ncbi:hypothetical protein [Cohnella cellulosilytica]|uniref:Uncharacterized protein n=1 Tax=Cohnella cellulosilytica TaxID=986710 RepID=A0ABW2F7P2_9BACL
MEKAKPMPQPAPQPAQKSVQQAATGHHGYHPAPAHKPVGKKVTKSMCEAHMHRYVEVQAADGFCYDGIVEHVDDEWLCLAVPGSVEPTRGFFPPPFYPPFGGGFYPFRPRRFNRLILPLAGLAAISLLPYYW